MRNDQGVALAAVVGMGLVLTVTMAGILTLSVSGTVKSGNDRDASNATAAAYAGLADYQSRLTADNSYESYGATTSFTGTSAFPQGTNGNPAFGTTTSGTTTSGTWAAVINSGGTEYYRYEVDNSQFSTSGILRLRVTGRSGAVTRSLVADLKGTGFIDYLYFTDYESQNPAVTGESVTVNNKSVPCTSQHMTDTNPKYKSSTACQPVQFAPGDVLTGPIRTNDEFTICGATFDKTVESTAPSGVYNNPNPTSCGQPHFLGGTTQNTTSLDLPATNGAMLQETRYDLTATTVPRPGCLYTGPTSITFLSNGNMTVVSPWTKATQIAIASNGQMTGQGQVATSAAALECGTISALHSSTGATVTVPANNLVYVQSVPSSSGDPNYYPATGTGSTPTLPLGAVFCNSVTNTVNGSPKTTTSSTYRNGLTAPSPLGTYPGSTEYTGPGGAASIYGCRNGDAFVQGSFHGALTIGAQNNLYVTGNITYTNANNDILGLVGQNTVTVWNPVSCSTLKNGVCQSGSKLLARAAKPAASSNVEIDAAIASNGGTFQVQNYAYGAQLGTLTVKGSIAQEFRGAVGTSGGTGFTKDYGYDDRLQNTAPPKFLQPVSTSYGVTTEVEVKPAYSVNGTPLS
jgi:Tfp pilus assembly protein PilX